MGISKTYTLVKTDIDYAALVAHIATSDLIAYDVESTGLNPRKATVIGAAICGQVGISFYMPLYTWNNTLQTLQETKFLKKMPEILALLSKKKLIMHNGSYDIRITKSNFNVDLTSALYCDTIMLKHTVEEEQPFALKEVAILKQKELGLDMYSAANQEQIDLKESIKKNGGSTTKTNMEMYRADVEVMSSYAAADTDLTLRLFDLYSRKLKAENLEKFFYEEEVMPLYKEVTIPMESNGIKLDMEKIRKMESEISADIEALEDEVHASLDPLADITIRGILNKECPISPSGRFGQRVAEFAKLDLKRTATGKFSMTAKAIEAARTDENSSYVEFLLTGNVTEDIVEVLKDLQTKLYLEITEQKHVFNISSKHQLSALFFDQLGEEPLSTTTKGTPQFNDAMLDELEDQYDAARLLKIYNKLMKIKSAYVDRFLRESEDGYFYPSFKQFGTVSGRYGSDMQQLNRPIPEEDKDGVHPLIYKYNNLIREFFIADEDRIFIDVDQESLEPKCFASDAQDKKLLEIFEKGYDMYSTIAIEVNNLSSVYSADKNADNYLKKLNPSMRAGAKCYALGIRYNMKEYKLAATLQMDMESCLATIKNYIDSNPLEHHSLVRNYLNEINEHDPRDKKAALELQDYRMLSARCIINSYFEKFKLLKKSMDSYINQLKTVGKVSSPYGRVRHLEQAKKIYDHFGETILDPRMAGRLAKKFHVDKADIKAYRRKLSTALNGALNFPIQSAAASIVNRAAIAINRAFKASNIDGLVVAQIHDQLIMDVAEKDVDKAMEIVQDKMENTTLLKGVKLVAPPTKAKNFKEGH